MRAKKRQKTTTQWNADTLRACFVYLDTCSLAQCEAVNKEWHGVAQTPGVWETFYCLWWRRGRSLPATQGLKNLTASDWKWICLHRISVSLKVTTRCSHHITRHQTVAVFAPSPLSVCTQRRIQPLAVSRRIAIQTRRQQSLVCYFEARFKGSGSIGFSSPFRAGQELQYGGSSKDRVGWKPVSYGYRSSDGRVHWAEGRSRYMEEYGPQWGIDSLDETARTSAELDTIGCGLDRYTGELFFTKNGVFLGFASVRVLTSREYAATVALSNRRDTVDINVGRKAFLFDIEVFITGGMGS